MKAFLLAVACGVMFAVSLPPTDWEWAGWVALAPLLVAAAGRRPLEAVGLGLLGGAVCGAVRVGWSRDTDRLFWAYLPFLWLMLLFALAALASSWARLWVAGLPWILFVAGVGVAGEWATTWLPLPLNIALCQFRDLPLIQIASVTGIWGVSFLLWLVNASLADAIIQIGGRRRLAPLGLAAALLLLSFGYGSLRLRQSRFPTLQVAAIQDFSGDEVGDLIAPTPDGGPDVDRVAMTRTAAQAATLIVWSEECLGAAFRPDDPTDPTRTLARQLKASLVAGYSDASRPKPFNCAAWVGPDGAVAGIHHKIHLYLGESQSVQRGGPPHAFSTPLGRVGLEICFDSCYTGVTRRLAADGARLIAMPNYDPPTPRGVLHELHAAMLPFRAVENGVPFVRSDSNGLSQIIAADGRIVAQGPLYAPDILTGRVALGDGQGTLFTRWGDWLAYVCVAGGLAYGIVLGSRAVTGRQRALRGASGGGPEPQPAVPPR